MRLALLLLLVFSGYANAELLNPDGTVRVGDKDWLQPVDLLGYSWNQVASVCDPITGTCSGSLGSVDLEGWQWATIGDVGALLAVLTPHPGNISHYSEINSLWAPQFFTLFNPTYSESRREFTFGITRTVFQTGDETRHWEAGVQDSFTTGSVDGVRTNSASSSFDIADSSRGAWLYRSTSVPESVSIDIKPGSDPNCFNVNGHGVIPVAVLSDETFDAASIDVNTLSFGGLDVRVRGNKGPLCSLEDINSDGLNDLVCQFQDNPEYWGAGEDEATLTGTLLDGTEIEGTDSICIVP